MKNKLKLLTMILLISGLGNLNLQAQKVISATGGDANGTGGSVSYTIGQMFNSTQTGTNGFLITEGVQQAYEIFTLTSVPQAENISLEILVYPNPVTEYLTIQLNDYETADLQFKIFNMKGNLLKTVKAKGNETLINASGFSSGIYFVKITDNQKLIKTFKIIKN
jgi:hypothetical protein